MNDPCHPFNSHFVWCNNSVYNTKLQEENVLVIPRFTTVWGNRYILCLGPTYLNYVLRHTGKADDNDILNTN